MNYGKLGGLTRNETTIEPQQAPMVKYSLLEQICLVLLVTKEVVFS